LFELRECRYGRFELSQNCLVHRLMDSNLPCRGILDEDKSLVAAAYWLSILRDCPNHCYVGTCEIDRLDRSLNCEFLASAKVPMRVRMDCSLP